MKAIKGRSYNQESILMYRNIHSSLICIVRLVTLERKRGGKEGSEKRKENSNNMQLVSFHFFLKKLR